MVNEYLLEKDRLARKKKEESRLEGTVNKGVSSPSLAKRVMMSPEMMKHAKTCRNPGIRKISIGRGEIDFSERSVEDQILEMKTLDGRKENQAEDKKKEPSKKQEQESLDRHKMMHEGARSLDLGEHYGVSNIAVECNCGEKFNATTSSGFDYMEDKKGNDKFSLKTEGKYIGQEKLDGSESVYGRSEKKKKATSTYVH